MKALVISDTHIYTLDDAKELGLMLEPYLGETDAIIHCGDFTSRYVFDYLRSQKPLYAVAGNMDSAEISQELAAKLRFDFGGYKIGVTHGSGSPHGIIDRVVQAFADDDLDAIIFGHSHQPTNTHKGKTLLLNPGSATDNRFTKVNSLAILTAEDSLYARIIEL